MAQWIPEDQRDTAWYLWHKLFMCRVSNIQSMSIEYIQSFGMPSSGIPELDNETANELVIRMLSVNQMIEFFKNGITVHVVNYKDTKEIYERISDHLNAWKQNLSTSFNIRNAPLEDLVLLDRFANVVYKHAVYQFTTDVVDSIIARRMSSTMRVSRENILAKPKNTVINPADGTEKVIEDKLPERTSMAEVFSQSSSTSGVATRWR